MDGTNAMAEAFRSKLPEARQRFLSQVVDHGLTSGLRRADEFLRHFAPRSIMQALANEPDRRARILEITVGVRAKVAQRKSPESSAEDLQIALDEGVTDAAAVVSTFEPDDRVRFLDAQLLWTYVVEPCFWLHTATSSERLGAIREHTAFIVRTALEHNLIGPRDVVRAISVPTLVEFLPRDDVASVLERALLDGRDGRAFSEAELLEVVGLRTLVDHVPLATIWEWVIGAKIAVPHGLATDNEMLFDAREAHPDADERTVIIGGPPPLVAAGGKG